MEIAALLAAATLFGGMALYSFGFAPLLFTRLPSEQAARLLREAFPWYYLFVIVTAGLAGILVVALDPFSALLLAATLLIGVVARQFLMPAINRARDASLGKAAPADGEGMSAAERGGEGATMAVRDAPAADAAAPAAEDVPVTDAGSRAVARRRFDRLHGLSVVLNFVQMAAVGWALARFL